MDDLISVIIPAYNVQQYIEKCVLSVLNQTYKNLEVIIVDDGSTDNTSFLCDMLEKNDPRVYVIHQKNGGLPVARNTGLDYAHGKWIAFLDSDDWVEPMMYERLYELAVQNDADIASCKTKDVVLGKNPEETNDDNSVIILTSDEMIAGLRNQTIVRFEVWNKLWKKELIGDVRFKKGQVCEDIYFDHVLFLKANKMVHINTSLHNYLISRPGNTNSSFRRAKLEGVKELHAFVDDLQSCDKKELASMIAAYGAEFTILVYLGTKKSKQDKMYMQTVIDEHKFFRKKAWGSGYENRKALLLFAISPWLYGKVLGLKERKMH